MVLITRTHAKDDESSTCFPGLRSIELPGNDLGVSREMIADRGKAMEDQPTIEEIGDDFTSGHSRLTYRHVPHERRACQSARPGHSSGQ